jgi:hypothetical protein
MNASRIKKSSGLLALDTALLLLGMLVLLMVLKMLRFDDSNPAYNAWTYLLGVPTALIAISMITRVLTNDVVEKSIQLGFLISVGIHLLLMLFAINMVLFHQHWPTNVQKVDMVATSNRPRAAQFFEPNNAQNESRPDYLKPVQTEQNSSHGDLSLQPQTQEPAQLSVDLAKNEVQPTLTERPFDKARAEPAPSQPTITSTAERLDRPDLTKSIEQPRSAIDVPSLEPTSPSPVRELQATQTEATRTQKDSRSASTLDPSITKLELDRLTNVGSKQGQPNKSAMDKSVPIERELDQAIQRAASELIERPSPTSMRLPNDADKIAQSQVPVPKLGTPSPSSPMDKIAERDTKVESRSSDARKSSANSVGIATFPEVSRIEPTVTRGVPVPNGIKSKPNSQANLPSENSFLSDPRFAMSTPGASQSINRDAYAPSNSIAPVSNEPISTEGIVAAPMQSQSPSTRTQSAPALGDSSKADLQRPLSKSSKASNPNSSLGPNLGGPAIDLGKDSWAAPFKDSPRKGPDLAKRDFTMPEIRDAELTVDRFKRPETGGPKIANAPVPIPAPAFSQRLRRNNDAIQDAAADLGPLGPQTEAAIERGLKFLAQNQREDGSWKLEDFGERVDMHSDTAATALSLLSFQGAGYTHQQFKYADVCGGAVQWLIKHQRANGDLYVRSDSKSDANAWLYSHSIATLALCEAFGMTQDEKIRANAQKAIDFLVQSQDPQAGGWRYLPNVGSDTSVTGWCMMALKSAELSGLDVSKESYGGIEKWLNASQSSEQQRYLYRYNWQAADTAATRHGRVPTPVMTSVGLLMRLYLGWRRTNPDMIRGTDWLLERIPAEGTVANPQRDTYYWYYATQVLFHMGGDRWKTWYEGLYPMLIRTQQQEGEFVGSWEPNGKIPDAWGRFGGRLYVTTLNLLSLEVYYRHLPIYEAAAD